MDVHSEIHPLALHNPLLGGEYKGWAVLISTQYF